MAVQKSLDKLAGGSAVECRDGLVGLLNAIQKGPAEETELAAASISQVLEALQQHLADSAVQRWGAATLEELFRRSAIRSDMAFHATSALVSGAQANLEAIEVQRWCFSALACCLTVGEDDSPDRNVLAVHMLSQDAMSVIAKSIRLHSTSPSLLDCAASLVCCMVMEGGEAVADEAFQTGCLRLILSTLAATLDKPGESNSLTADASLQQACLRALWAICESNGELGATEIAADDGFESIISILAQDQGNAEVHKWCASLLQSLLAQGGDLVAESAMLAMAAEALVASIAMFGTDLDVIERCAAALATLAAYGPDAAVSVLEAGGLCAVEEAADLHGLDGALGHWYHALQEAIEHCTDTIQVWVEAMFRPGGKGGVNYGDIPPNQTLYVNNLNEKIKVPELKNCLLELFSSYGEVIDIVAAGSMAKKGQAFVVFRDISCATNALRALNGFTFLDKPMKINYCRTKSDVVAHEDGTWKPRAKLEAQKEEAKRPKTTPALVPPKNAAPKAAAHPAGGDPDGNASNVLFVENLPAEVNELMLTMLFRQYPGFQEARLIKGRNVAFIEYADELQAGIAKHGLQGFMVTPEMALKIAFAKQ